MNEKGDVRQVTMPCQRYVEESAKLVEYVGFVGWLAISMDQTKQYAIEALLPGETDQQKIDEYTEFLQNPKPTQTVLRQYNDLICQTMWCRAVDNFLTYISELLSLVFTHRPEALKSSDKMKIEDILEHGTMDELIRTIAERRVHELSYQGMRDLARYLEERLSFELFPSKEDFSHAVRSVEIRNIIVHNRRVVNSVSAKKNAELGFRVGYTIALNITFVLETMRRLDKFALSIDERAVEKFNLTCDGQVYPTADDPSVATESTEMV